MIKGGSTFYPFTIATNDKRVVLVYGVKTENKTRIFFSHSADGAIFKDKYEIDIVSKNGKRESMASCDELSFFISGDDSYLSYWQNVRGKRQMMIAKSVDMIHFEVMEKHPDLLELFSIISNHKYKQNFLAYCGSDSIYASASDDLSEWHATCDLLSPRKDFFDNNALSIVGTLVVERGILVLYKVKNKNKQSLEVVIGGALFSLDSPYTLLWRSEVPILKEKVEKKKHPARFLGSAIIGDSLYIYWSSLENEFFVKTVDLSASGLVISKDARTLTRHSANPILAPKTKNKWEQDATFNPAALYLDNKIHLLYRAIGENGISVLGYASSTDGFAIDERLEYPVFELFNPLLNAKKNPSIISPYVSGGSWAGCEDPRITHIGNRIYMTYVMFDGCNPPGVALTSISVDDFLNKVWKWKKPIFISKPGEIQKNWMVFPEKINGKYAVLHSITPKISIEYVDTLDNDKMVIESMKMPGEDAHRWDNIVRGAGSPPLKTKYGWLVLYHAMDKRDPNKYKVGAMILDHDDPTKILHRCKHPILEPSATYENHGAKSGVVYVCGAVIKGNTLFVYYGGADSVVCVATEILDKFLDALVMHTTKIPAKPSLLKIINQIKQK